LQKATVPQNEIKLGKLLKITKLLRIAKLSKLGKANIFMDKIDEYYLDLIVSVHVTVIRKHVTSIAFHAYLSLSLSCFTFLKFESENLLPQLFFNGLYRYLILTSWVCSEWFWMRWLLSSLFTTSAACKRDDLPPFFLSGSFKLYFNSPTLFLDV
jgi:hypothetical protein